MSVKSIKIYQIILLVALIAVAGFGFSKAAFSEQINFQGKLTDNNNLAVPNGSYNFEFILYATSTGGSPLWTETATGSNQITVTNGLFSNLLGSITSLSSVDFNQTLWLEIKVGGTSTSPSWETLSPRKKLGAVPAAFEAKKLSGKLESAFGTLAENETVTGLWNFNNILSVASSSASTTLTITQNGTGTIVDIKNATGSVFIINNAGIITTGTWSATTIGVVFGGTGTSTASWTGFPYITNGAWGTSSTGFLSGGQENYIPYWTSSNTLGTSTIYNNGGNIGIGTTSPAFVLDVYGSLRIVSTSTFWGNIDLSHGTSTVFIPYNSTSSWSISDATNTYMIFNTTNGGQKIIMGTDVEFGTIQIDQNAGAVSLVDFPVTSAAASGTEESYVMQINSNPLLMLYSQSDGLGGVKNLRVGIATTSPASTLTVYGTTTLLGGNVGVGTTTPSYTLDVYGTFRAATTSLGALTTAGNILPATTTTYDLGSTAFRWANIYANTSTLGNVASGTWQGAPVVSTYGGTGTTSAFWTGFVKVASGTWSTSAITDADIPDTITITNNATTGTIWTDANIPDNITITNNATTGTTLTTFAGTLPIASTTGNYVSTLNGLAGAQTLWGTANLLTVSASGTAGQVLSVGTNVATTGVTTLSSLSSIGTITTGTWNATKISNAYGGTGASSTNWTGYVYVTGGTWGTTTALSSGVTSLNGQTGSQTLWGTAGVLTINASGTVGLVFNVPNNATTGTALSSFAGAVTDAQVPDTITITNNATTGTIWADANIPDNITITNNATTGTTLTTFAGTLPIASTTGNYVSTLNGLAGAQTLWGTANLLTVSASGTAGQVLSVGTNVATTGVTTLSSLSSIGTITTGTWNATKISNAYGGTGASSTNWTGYVYVTGGTWGTTTAPSGSGADTDWIISGTTMYSTGTVNYVGIGTTSPATTLTVYGTTTFMGGNLGIGTTAPNSKLQIIANLGEIPFKINQINNFTEILRPSATGTENNLISLLPTVAAVTGGSTTTNAVSHVVNMPSGIQPNDLLIVFFSSDGNPTITFPAGWTNLFQERNAIQVRFGAWYRVADGNETTSINVTTSASEMTAHTSYRITNYYGVPATGTAATTTSANPNPPSLTPSWGALNTLWFAAAGYDYNRTVSGYPTGYINGRNDYSNNTSGSGIGTAYRYATTTPASASEDPGTFTISSSDDWVANTIGISPITTNWTYVAEPNANDDTTYIYGDNVSTYTRDLYNMTNHGLADDSSVINSVTVYARCRATTTPSQVSLKIVVKTGTGAGAPDTITEDTATTVTASYADYYKTWSQNPKTSAAWQWSEIDNMEIGVSLRSPTSSVALQTRCTQVYTQVAYTTLSTSTFTIDSSGNVVLAGGNLQINTFSFKPISDTELAVYDSTNQQVLIFDEGTSTSPDPIWGQGLSEEFSLGTFYQTVTADDMVYLDTISENNYYSEGTFKTIIHEFEQTENFQMFRATADISAGTAINVVLESSDDNFTTIKDYLNINLLNGARNYDAFQLEDAKFFRARFNFSTQNSSITPKLSYFEIQGFIAETQLVISDTGVLGTTSDLLSTFAQSTDTLESLTSTSMKSADVTENTFEDSNSNGFLDKLRGLVKIFTNNITGFSRIIFGGDLEANNITSNGSFQQIIKVARTVIQGRTLEINNSIESFSAELKVASKDQSSISFVTYSIIAPKKEIILSGSSKLIATDKNSANAKIIFHPSVEAIISKSTSIKVIITPTSAINGTIFVSQKSASGFTAKVLNYRDEGEKTFDWMVIANLIDSDLAEETLGNMTENMALQADLELGGTVLETIPVTINVSTNPTTTSSLQSEIVTSTIPEAVSTSTELLLNSATSSTVIPKTINTSTESATTITTTTGPVILEFTDALSGSITTTSESTANSSTNL